MDFSTIWDTSFHDLRDPAEWEEFEREREAYEEYLESFMEGD